jgi:hypothetical protein
MTEVVSMVKVQSELPDWPLSAMLQCMVQTPNTTSTLHLAQKSQPNSSPSSRVPRVSLLIAPDLISCLSPHFCQPGLPALAPAVPSAQCTPASLSCSNIFSSSLCGYLYKLTASCPSSHSFSVSSLLYFPLEHFPLSNMLFTLKIYFAVFPDNKVKSP